MYLNYKHFLILISFLLVNMKVAGQPTDTSSFGIDSRLSFYSFEKNGEFLVQIPATLAQSNLAVEINSGGTTLISWKGKASGTILRLPFPITFAPSVYQIFAKISVAWKPGFLYVARTELKVLPYKSNEVKTDRLTGGLIVNRRQFFPFGFYTYSPVSPTLPEEEIVKGFNVISPYQKILPETLSERKAYMDRCAQIGMKVHYNLLSVSGGGGVGSKIDSISEEEKRARLLKEIELFRDHPALLAWYISDEPNGNRIPPETIEEIYNTVKKADPWHPVSVVITAPFMQARRYTKGLDILMADPYPLPELQASFVGDITGQLKELVSGKKPLWIVPQAFGGGEIWKREPTIQEIRSMTWQAIINGAGGIQYFVRQGLNYFPKSAAVWGECGRIAVEVAELTPWLLSDEETMPAESYSQNVLVSSKTHDGQLVVMAVNRKSEPINASLRIKGLSNTRARVLFENRFVPVIGGVITDELASFGSQVYLIDLKPEKQTFVSEKKNLLLDPGFEDLSSPGVPSACYARPGGDRGATFFTDSREHFEGNHSVRLVTPQEGKSAALRFFPFQVKAGASYTISLWAKSDPEQRFSKQENTGPQYVEVLLGEFSRARFVPDSSWKRFVTFVTIPTDTLATFKTNLILKMPGQGVAWFDEIKVFEELNKK
ncbi:MAG: hypothetical protein IPJ16_13685 [Bacteroidales bacterium]|nr:hypothetical protein [Bacteroidales bacterium]